MEILSPGQVFLILCEMSDADASKILDEIGEPPAIDLTDEIATEWLEKASAALIQWRARNRGGAVG